MPKRKTPAPTRIKCLVLRWPHFEEIMLGEKPIEYRSWSVDYRGPLVIAAAKRKDSGEYAGRAVCVVELVEIRKVGEKDFEWVIEDPRPIWPVPIKGRLGLFEVEIPLDFDVQLLVRDDDSIEQ